MRNAPLRPAPAPGTPPRRTAPGLLIRAAELAGTIARGVPGIVGAGCVCAGLAMVYLPAGVIAAGVFLLLIDHRRP